MFILELNCICDKCQNRGWYNVYVSTETSVSVSSKKCEVCKDFIGEKHFSFEISKELWTHFRDAFRDAFFNENDINFHNKKVIKDLFCSSCSVDTKSVKTKWEDIEKLFKEEKQK